MMGCLVRAFIYVLIAVLAIWDFHRQDPSDPEYWQAQAGIVVGGLIFAIVIFFIEVCCFKKDDENVAEKK